MRVTTFIDSGVVVHSDPWTAGAFGGSARYDGGMTNKPKQTWCRPTLRDFYVLFAGMAIGTALALYFYPIMFDLAVEYWPIVEPAAFRTIIAAAVIVFSLACRRMLHAAPIS
jgi:hypothetical protein